MRRLILVGSAAAVMLSAAGFAASPPAPRTTEGGFYLEALGGGRPAPGTRFFAYESVSGPGQLLGTAGANGRLLYMDIGVNVTRLSGKTVYPVVIQCPKQAPRVNMVLGNSFIDGPWAHADKDCDENRTFAAFTYGMTRSFDFKLWNPPGGSHSTALDYFMKPPILAATGGGAALGLYYGLRRDDGDDGGGNGGGGNLPLTSFLGTFTTQFQANGGCSSFTTPITISGVNANTLTMSFFDLVTWNLSGTGTVSGDKLSGSLNGTTNFNGTNVPTTSTWTITGSSLTGFVNRNFGGSTNCQQAVTGTKS